MTAPNALRFFATTAFLASAVWEALGEGFTLAAEIIDGWDRDEVAA